MIRKTLLGVAAIAAASFTAIAGLPAGTVAQETAGDAEVVEVQAAGVSLELGQRYEGVAWDVEAQDVFVVAAPDRVAWSEVRIAIALRNNAVTPLPYSSTAFFDGDGYPRLALVDAFDVTRIYEMLEPAQDAVPNSNVTEIPPGLTGRWTVGFEVPTVNVDSMLLRLLDPATGVLADWDLTTATDPAGWTPPPFDTVAVGEVFDWGDQGLLVRPDQFGSLVCGDPDNQLVTHVFALQIDVTNASFVDDIAFPGVRLPDTAAVAQWSDGSTAQLTYETFGGEAETLRKFASDLVFIPPTDGEFFPRGFVFGVTRDSRVGDVDDGPQGVQLNRPDDTPVWLELEGLGELLVNPRFCDLGHFAGPLALAFTPVGDLDVGRPDIAPPTDDDINQVAADTIVQAVIVIGQLAVDLDNDFSGVTADDLNALWPQLNFADGLVRASPGIIGVDVLSPTQILLMTLSPVGEYHCGSFDVDAPVTVASGEDFDSTLNACLPPDETPDEQAGADAGTTTTTTSTTTTTIAP